MDIDDVRAALEDIKDTVDVLLIGLSNGDLAVEADDLSEIHRADEILEGLMPYGMTG